MNIQTPTKAQISFLSKLQQKKYRELYQKFIVTSPKVIWEQFDNPLLEAIYVTDNFYQKNEANMVFKNTFRLSEKDMHKISPQITPAGILGLFKMPVPKKFNFKSNNILLLDDIQDAGNLGTIIRTAEWFGYYYIFLSKDCVEAYNSKVVAATMGSIFNVNIYNDTNLIKLVKDLQKEKYQVVATDLAGGKIKLTKQLTALIIGNEARGVNSNLKKLANQLYKIDKFGKADSLNAAVSAGIAMNHLRK